MNGKHSALREADLDTFGEPKAPPAKPANAAALIIAAKVEHYEDKTTTGAEILALGREAQALQAQLEDMQREAQQKLNLKAAPVEVSLERIKREVNRLTVAFQERDATRDADIKALERTAANNGRTDST